MMKGLMDRGQSHEMALDRIRAKATAGKRRRYRESIKID